MIHSPIIIIGCARSGTTLLYTLLSEVPSLWSIGYESKAIIEKYHHPATQDWASGALGADDLTQESRAYMLDAFQRQAAPGIFWRRLNRVRGWMRGNRAWRWIRRRGKSDQAGAMVSSALPQWGLDFIRSYVRGRNRLLPGGTDRKIRLIEKTPENCLRLPFLLELFPDARILYLVRDGRPNINSLIEGWRHPYLFASYTLPDVPAISNLKRKNWAFTLIPGWRDLVDQSVEEICAWQWVRCNEAVLAHKKENEGHVPYLIIRFEELINHPESVLPNLADFLEIDFEYAPSRVSTRLPRINILTEPGEAKWRHQNPEAVWRVLPIIAPMMETLGYEIEP